MKLTNLAGMILAAGVSLLGLCAAGGLGAGKGGEPVGKKETRQAREPGGNNKSGDGDRTEAATAITAAVRDFVDGQEAFAWRGLSILDKAGELEFGRRLTVSLRSLLAACKTKVPEYIQAHPGEKVPFPEGSLLSGTYGAVHDWKIAGIGTTGSLALVRVTVFSGEADGESTPSGIVLVMISEAGAWRVDDVYDADSDGSLRTALRFLLVE